MSKAVVFTDIHFGLKNNSDEFNQCCLEFIDYMIDIANKENISTCYFLGDWHHFRSNIAVNTLSYSIEGLRKLNEAFDDVVMLLGNHDLFYRNRLDINSMIIANNFTHIRVIDKPTQIEENVLFVPWLCNGEKLSNYKSEFIFCHAEIPTFNVNQKIKLDGEYNPLDYKTIRHIYSGHFHKRQTKNNITYIGACFSHDFSDVDDYHNKGFMIFNPSAENDEDMQKFYEWDSAPKYMVLKSSEIKNKDIPINTSLKIINDLHKSNREMIKLQSELKDKYELNTCTIQPMEVNMSEIIDESSIEVNKAFQSLDITILELLKEVHYDNINNEMLQSIYRELN